MALGVAQNMSKVMGQSRIAVLGDDSVVAVPPAFLPPLLLMAKQLWLELGFNLKAVSSGNWNTAEFCSGFFWNNGGTRVFGPHPGRVISKTFWCLQKYSEAKEVAWLRGVCLGLQLTCGVVPILGSLIPRLVLLAGPGKTIVRNNRHVRIDATAPHTAEQSAYEQLSEITNLSLNDIITMDREVGSILRLDHQFVGDAWRKLCESAI